jgi:hypothetical protein
VTVLINERKKIEKKGAFVDIDIRGKKKTSGRSECDCLNHNNFDR